MTHFKDVITPSKELIRVLADDPVQSARVLNNGRINPTILTRGEITLRDVTTGTSETLPINPVNQRVLVKAQNVHDYFQEHFKEHKWNDLTSFKCSRPPFKNLCFTYDHEFGRVGIVGNHLVTRAVHVFVSEYDRERFQFYLDPDSVPNNFSYNPELGEVSRIQMLEIVAATLPEYFIEVRVILDHETELPGRFFVMIDGQGQVLQHNGYAYFYIISPDELTHMEQNGFTGAVLDTIISKHTAIALACLQFMNCKNAEIVEHKPTRQQRRQAEREGRRPPIIFKTLVIHPVGKRAVYRKLAYQGRLEGRVSQHIVRGHLKDYRQGRGLGRGHGRGVWWWSPQLRGNREVGRVVKDYEVKP